MELIRKEFSVRSAAATLAYTLVINTAIAFILTAVGYGGGFAVNLVFSQCIGFCICAAMMGALQLGRVHRAATQLLLMGGALTGGAVAGLALGTLASRRWFAFTAQEYRDVIAILAISVLFGIAASYFFISRDKIVQARARLQDERIQRLTLEKQMAETRLKLLQAQIEPHFLYNTLGNILSLMETDVAGAQAMLADLAGYLRATLARTRETTATLEQEIAVVRRYLDIFKRRLGGRLRYTITLPEHLRGHPFPPLVVQPLVENAVHHGIEGLVAGGTIAVQAEAVDARLRVRVSDNGRGIAEAPPAGGGLGLANVRARLEALYGHSACLTLVEPPLGGVTATIEVPLAPL